jgi:hypothetical protein
MMSTSGSPRIVLVKSHLPPGIVTATQLSIRRPRRSRSLERILAKAVTAPRMAGAALPVASRIGRSVTPATVCSCWRRNQGRKPTRLIGA